MGALQAPRESAIDGLIAALKDTDAAVRRQAVAALASLNSRRASVPIAALLKDENADVRTTAANTLAELEDAAAIDPLIGAIADKMPAGCTARLSERSASCKPPKRSTR